MLLRLVRPGLVSVILAGAALRFATLDVQSLWGDEGLTAAIVAMPFGDAMSTIPDTESSPPLYYLLVWLWTGALGESEVALRSLSALFGTLTIPVAYAIGAELRSRTAGLMAAALVAGAPLLVWYSQDARPYALLALLSGLSFLYFLRGSLWAWALFSALAVATHYFALFTVVPEALWLLLRARPRARVAAAVALPAAVALAALPLQLHQADVVPHPWAQIVSLRRQVSQSAQQFLVGLNWTDAIHDLVVPVLALAVLAAIGLLLRPAAADARRSALPVVVIAGAGFLLPLAIGLFGDNYLAARNVLGLWPLLAALIALGAATARRIGVPLVAGLCAAGVALTVAVAVDEDLQRDDWRGIVAGVRGSEAVLVVNRQENASVVRYYLPGARPGSEPISDLAVVGRPTESPAFGGVPPAPGFTPSDRRSIRALASTRFRSPTPTPLPAAPYGRTQDELLLNR